MADYDFDDNYEDEVDDPGADDDTNITNDDNDIISPSNDEDALAVSEDDLNSLEKKADGIERGNYNGEPSFGIKMCPTRHGCQGATDCDNCLGNYPPH